MLGQGSQGLRGGWERLLTWLSTPMYKICEFGGGRWYMITLGFSGHCLIWLATLSMQGTYRIACTSYEKSGRFYGVDNASRIAFFVRSADGS
jgi:hypothetical protein